jgi:hypothetical protein
MAGLLGREGATLDAEQAWLGRLVRCVVRRVAAEWRMTAIVEGRTADRAAAHFLTSMACGDGWGAEDVRVESLVSAYAPLEETGEEDGGMLVGEGSGSSERSASRGSASRGSVGAFSRIIVMQGMLQMHTKEAALACRALGWRTAETMGFFTGRMQHARGGLTAAGAKLAEQLLEHRPDGGGIMAVLSAPRKLSPVRLHDRARPCALCGRWLSERDDRTHVEWLAARQAERAERAEEAAGEGDVSDGTLLAMAACFACRLVLAETRLLSPRDLAITGHGRGPARDVLESGEASGERVPLRTAILADRVRLHAIRAGHLPPVMAADMAHALRALGTDE